MSNSKQAVPTNTPSEAIIQICNNLLLEESPIYPEALAKFFNSYYEQIRTKFGFAPQWSYARINHHETIYKKSGRRYVTPLLKHYDKKTIGSGRVLTIRFDAFNDPPTRQAILLVEIWRIILSRLYRNENDALDASFALAWDIISDSELRQKILELWNQTVPVKETVVARAPSLKRYVKTMARRGQYYYSREIIPRYLGVRRVSRKRGQRFAFVRGPRVRELNKRELPIFKTVLSLNSDSPKLVSAHLGISSSSASKLIQSLKAGYFIRNRWSLSSASIGLRSMIALFQTPLSQESKISQLRFPTTRAFVKFKQIDLLAFFNFYYPSQPYAKKRFEAWKNSLFSTSPLVAHSDASTIEILELPIISWEIEKKKINVQRPELFDPVLGLWTLGDSLSFEEMAFQRNLAKPVSNPPSLSPEEKQLAFDVFARNPKSIEQFLKQRKGNRNRLSNTIRQLLKHGILRREVIMPFFDDLDRIFVLVRNIKNRYSVFIEEIAARCPVSNSTLLETDVLISFLAVPPLHKIELLELIQDLFPSAQLAMFPDTLESSRRSLSVIATKTGWKLQPLPSIRLSYHSLKK